MQFKGKPYSGADIRLPGCSVRFRERPARPSSSGSESSLEPWLEAHINSANRSAAGLELVCFLLVFATLLMLFLLSGCTYDGAAKRKAQRALEPGLQRMVTGTVDSLHALPTTNRTEHTVVATRLAEQAQLIAGTPAERIDVDPLIRAEHQRQSAYAAGTNVTLDPIASGAERKLAAEIAAQGKLVAREREATQALVERGEVAEAQRNSRIKRWFAWLSFGGLGIGGVIALMVFVPVSIPLLGRLLASAVSAFPKLAGFVGVVGTKAFDGVVKGVENAKSELGFKQQDLLDSLSKAMDQDHKDLVRARRPVVTAIPQESPEARPASADNDKDRDKGKGNDKE